MGSINILDHATTYSKAHLILNLIWCIEIEKQVLFPLKSTIFSCILNTVFALQQLGLLILLSFHENHNCEDFELPPFLSVQKVPYDFKWFLTTNLAINENYSNLTSNAI